MKTANYIALTETHPESTRPLTVGCAGTKEECDAFARAVAYPPVGVPSDGRLYVVEPTAGRRSSANAPVSAGDRVHRMTTAE